MKYGFLGGLYGGRYGDIMGNSMIGKNDLAARRVVFKGRREKMFALVKPFPSNMLAPEREQQMN